MSTSVRLEDELKERIQNLAESRQRSPHWIMIEAIQQYVEREEKRDSFLQEALASWKHYKETGLHITGEELSAWLKTWGNGENIPPPKCHK